MRVPPADAIRPILRPIGSVLLAPDRPRAVQTSVRLLANGQTARPATNQFGSVESTLRNSMTFACVLSRSETCRDSESVAQLHRRCGSSTSRRLVVGDRAIAAQPQAEQIGELSNICCAASRHSQRVVGDSPAAIRRATRARLSPVAASQAICRRFVGMVRIGEQVVEMPGHDPAGQRANLACRRNRACPKSRAPRRAAFPGTNTGRPRAGSICGAASHSPQPSS